MLRSIIGFNREAKNGKEAAHKYCRNWQTELTSMSATIVGDFTQKKKNQAV